MNIKKTFLKTVAFVLVSVFTGNCIVSGNETTLGTINYPVSEIESTNSVYSTNNYFNIHKYIADNILDDSTGANCAYFNYIKSPGRFKNMGEIWFESFSRDADFVKSVIAWESLNLALDPGDAAKKAIEAKGYYMTVLLSIMDCKSENSVDEILKSMGEIKTVSKYYQSFVKLFKEVYKNLEESDLDDILKLRKDTFTKDEVEMLRELQKEWFEKNFEESKLGQYADVFKEYMMMYDSAKTVNELINQFESFCMIAQISDEWKECIKYMYFHCDSSNLPFYAALKDLYDIVMSDNYELMALGVVAKNKILDISASAYSTGVNALLDSLLGQCPFIKGIDLGKSISKPLINMLFSTDKVIEGFYILSAYCDIIELIESAVNDAENRYISDRTPENANEFIKYIDIFFEATEIGNNLGQDFTDILYTKGVANILFRSADEYKSFVSLRKMYSDYAQEAHKRINKSWLNDLYYDYPDIYTAYAELLGSEYFDFISVTSVAFEKDSVEWGLTDAEFKGYNHEIYPSNADNKEVFFTTTDSKVAEITNDGILKVNGMGSCVITVTAFDNEDATDTLNVTVVEENGADSTPLPEIIPIQPNEPTENDFPYIVNDDGSTITVIGYKGSGTAITIPEKIDGMSVTGVGHDYLNSYNFASVISMVIPNSVTSIGEYTFAGCDSLTSLTIPDSVANIGSKAFEKCIALKSIIIPDGVASIEANTFSGCSSLVSLTIPDSVESIGSGAFKDCDSLVSIVIPANIKSIEDATFSGCCSLASIEIPKNVTSIGEFAFAGCDSLTSIEIPSNVLIIGDSAYSGCNSLISVLIASENINIGYGAFSYCSLLKTVSIPNGVANIGDLCFRRCKSLVTVNILNGFVNIGKRAFEDCVSLTSILISDIDGIKEYITNEQKIGNESFKNCYSLTTISIPNGITNIGEAAFSSCQSIETIIIPDSVVSIGAYAFGGCYSLTSIRMSDNVTKINKGTFSYCYLLTSINIPERVTNIDDSAFYFCTSLTSIAIPESVINIGDSAFSDCSSLTSVSIPYGVENIKNSTFYKCSSLTSIIIPNSVMSIGDYAFGQCNSLKSIIIPNSVTSIGKYAFALCNSLHKIVISNGVISIGKNAFYDYYSGKSVIMPSSVSSIDDNAFNSTYTTFYCIADSYAITYAKNNSIEFHILGADALYDTETQVIVQDPDLSNLTLIVTKYESDSTPDSVTYNIILKDKSGNSIQPNEDITVKIPVPEGWIGTECRIYRKEKNNKYIDMMARLYKDDYEVFTTNHLSEYVITTENLLSIGICGDLNNDGKLNDQDSILLDRHLAEWGNTIDISAADMNGDGKVNDQDSIILARTLAGWYD